MSSTEDQIKSFEKRIASEKAKGAAGRLDKVESYEDEILKLKRKLKKEESEVKPHPSLQFGPISQTVAIMASISLCLSVIDLPNEVVPFYRLFSSITVIAVTCIVVHSSIIWYGYTQAIAKMPKPEGSNEKLRKMMKKAKTERPDAWAHTRSHPSAFLTTTHAAPKLFPFPLGKTRPEATVRDELWWEGGNAPHVGHFNRPKIAEPPQMDEETLMGRVRESMAIEKHQNLWKRRIRSIQYLCCVIIISYVNRSIAIAGLCWLIYNTLANELDDMLKPPTDMSEIEQTVQQLVSKSGRNEAIPKAKPGQPVGGMGYIYDPTEAGTLKPDHHANIPINIVPPHVLMTTDNHWYAGPGEQIK